LKTGKIEILADNYQGKPLQGPNDVTIDSKGRLFSRIWPVPLFTASMHRVR